MSDGRSLPRTSLTFTDMADLVLLDDVLLRATGLSERQHLRRKVLRMKIRDAANRLDGKSGNPYWRVQDLRAEREDGEGLTPRDGDGYGRSGA